MALDDVDVAGVFCHPGAAPSRSRARAGGGRAFDGDRTPGVGESLNGLKADISVLAGLDVSRASDEELLAGAEALAGLASRLGAVRGRWLLAIGERGSWRASGERTLARWNEKASGQSPAAAAREIARAQSLGEELPVMAAALESGDVFAEHVDGVRRVFSTPALREALRREGVQEEIVQWARQFAPREFERRLKARALREDPAMGVAAEKDEAAREKVVFSPAGWGMRVSGWLSSETSALVDTALSAFMGRKDADDSRTLPERRAGALVELASARLDEGTLAAGARIRPHLSVHVPLATLMRLEGAADGCPALDANDSSEGSLSMFKSDVAATGGVDAGGVGAAETDRTDDGVSPDASRRCVETGGQGRAGACLEKVRWQRKKLGPLLAVIPSAIDLKALVGAEPAAFDDGTALSMTQLARLTCDSSAGRIVFSATGEVLDAGRSKRLFTPGQTRAVIARDRTCRYPGCSETIAHGQIHHALPWRGGGATDLANAVLLCWHHHALVHREMTTIAHHDGGFIFTRPDGTVIGTRRHGV